MSIREDVELYTKLSGEDGSQETIATIGAYLRGYRQGKEDAEPRWIPVTEEPIPDGEYLVTWTSEIQEKPILSIICKYSGVWDCWELQALGHQNIKILAYMPLPEPYKGVTT